MLDIIVLIFLTRNIGALAIKKGLKPGPWKLYTVLGWLGGELLGVFLAVAVFEENEFSTILFVGLGAALASFFILKAILNSKPDVDDDIDYIGQDVRN